MRLILASASPRRAELLTAAGFEFEVRITNIDEAPRAGESPREYVLRLAKDKASAAQGPGHERRLKPAAPGGHADEGQAEIILAADTTVVVDSEILGKPVDQDDARRMLGQLSGRAHEVLTGVSLKCGSDERWAVESTAVWFKPLTEQEIAWYVASGEGRDKAGAYAIQGLASRFIPRIDGSYANVVGLPVATVHRLLHELDRSVKQSSAVSKFG
jgi:septum formation protein